METHNNFDERAGDPFAAGRLSVGNRGIGVVARWVERGAQAPSLSESNNKK
jgi:hypothetical protein